MQSLSRRTRHRPIRMILTFMLLICYICKIILTWKHIFFFQVKSVQNPIYLFTRQALNDPNQIFLPSPIAASVEVLRVAPLLASIVKGILYTNNWRGQKEIGKEHNERHSPYNSECKTASHKAHGILLTHHCDDLHFKASYQCWIFVKVWADKNIGHEAKS